MLTCVQIPVTKDVCIFCLARTQFAPIYDTRRPQRRLFSSSRALHRPPVNQLAEKEENEPQDSDPLWRSQPPRPFAGRWARTRAPATASSDLTPEEEALRNQLHRESTRASSTPKVASLREREIADAQGHSNTQISSSMTQRNGRISDVTPAEASRTAPVVESAEKKSRTDQDTPVAPSPPPPPPRSEPQISKKPRFGSWAKRGTSVELTPEEQAFRKALRKEAAPKPPLPVHQISHSPHTSSLPVPPSRPDIQKEDVRSEETRPNSPSQNPSINPRDAQKSRIYPETVKFSQARDSQLDRHIFQSRAKPEFRDGDWHCPSCEGHNFASKSWCFRCGTRKPFEPTTAHEERQNPEHWKHVRRMGYRDLPEASQPERNHTQELSRDTQAIDRARTMEQEGMDREKMERMERTKDGGFVGLRGQYDTITSKATNNSYWSSETNEPQMQDVVPTPSNTSNDSVTKKPSTGRLVNWRSRSTEELQMDEVRAFRDKRSNQMVADQSSAFRPETAKLTGGWKRWDPHADGKPPVEDSLQHDRFNRIQKSTKSSSAENEQESNARGAYSSPRYREQRNAKQLIADSSMHYSRERDRVRIRSNKTTVSPNEYEFEDEDEGGRLARRLERTEQRKKAKATKKAMAPPTPIYLPEFISVSNLAAVLRVRSEDFIHKMIGLGFEEIRNDHILDAETAGLVAAEFNFEPIFDQAENPDLVSRPPAEDKSVLPSRPPVVTIMGHVDHGKTTLLDYLRKSSVAASEHGGITQHIGAFSVPMPGGRLVTFLDTPGHEAFLSMRQRGANVTDIVILVVAADDSVKPQTIEAIKHAQTAKVPMIVAVNKIDKEDSNVERVKQDLTRYGVEIEDFGGETQVVCVSGKTGQGMGELEAAAVALADILDMRSEIDGQAEGWVLEATTKKAGRVATVLVKRGTLRPGDIIVAGTSWARVRSLRNEAGAMLKSAGPGTPVEIDGWREQPAAGDEVLQAPDEQRAKAVTDYRLEAHERTRMATDMIAVNEARRLELEKREELKRLEELAELAETSPDAAAAAPHTEERSTPSTPSCQEVPFVIKADVSGSVEAVTNAISALGNMEIRPRILRTGVGPVTEFDVDHAAVAQGSIISFNTTIDGNIHRMAEARKVKLLDQSIIYRLVDDVRATLSEKLPAVITQKVIGEAEVAQVFEINTKGRIFLPVAGCRVKNGVIGRSNKVRVLRDKEIIFDGMSHEPIFLPFPFR